MKSVLLNILIIVVVTTGVAIIPIVGGASTGSEPLRSLFFAFVSAIIAVQLIPAVMLLGGLLKAAFAAVAKKQES